MKPHPTKEAATPNHARRAAWAVGALFFANGSVVGSWVPQIPGVAHRLHLSTQGLGAVLLASGIGALTAMTRAGTLGRRFGTRLVSVVGGVALPCFLAAGVFAPTPWIAAAYLFGTGLAGASMDVAMNAQGVRVEQQLGTRTLSLFHGLFSVGCFAGSGIASTALARGAHPGTVALALAVALVALVLAVSPFLLAHSPSPASQPAGLVRLLHIHSSALLLLGALTFAAFVSEGGIGDWSALLLESTRGLTLGTAGFGYTCFSAAMLLARLTGDRVASRLGEERTLRISGILASVGLAAVLLSPGLPMVFVGFFAAGLGLANASPILYRSAGQVPGYAPEVALSIAVGLGYVGLLGGPPLLGVLAHHAGLRSIFVTIIALQLFVSFSSGHVLRRRPAQA